MQLIPNRFLFRTSHPCRYVPNIPNDDEQLFSLGTDCRLDNFGELDGKKSFADVRIAWNEGGLAIELRVSGKSQEPTGDANKPNISDGLALWIDTRDSRTSHRGSRFCHLFYLLPTGGEEEQDQPAFVQRKINRATADAATASAQPIRYRRTSKGYELRAYIGSDALTGWDPEQYHKMGIFYAVRDEELGEQTLGAANDLPYAEDPTLWSVLELVGRPE
jgi:hypothetical protein